MVLLTPSRNVIQRRKWSIVHIALCTLKYPKLKADMKSYILLQTTAIFFSIELISKTGYWIRVCHGWFHLQGLSRAVRNASRARITKWNILAHCGIRTRGLPLPKQRRYHWATKTDVNRMYKSSPGLTVLFLEIYLQHIVITFCKLFTVSKLLNWSNNKTIQILYDKNTGQIILLDLSCAAGKFLKIAQL